MVFSVKSVNSKNRTLKLRKAFEVMKARMEVHREAELCQKKLIFQKV